VKWALKQVQGDESFRIYMSQPDIITPDSEHRGLIGLMPQSWRGFALLARFDRPIGWWLLFWPCAFGILLAGDVGDHWPLLFWMLLGSIVMRGAGCVYNDIVDRDLDAMVARTASRPLPSGQVGLRAAWIWLTCLCVIGLTVLMQLRQPCVGRCLSVYEADYLVAARVARFGVQLGRAGWLDRRHRRHRCADAVALCGLHILGDRI
jgi:UbiA prenyltransferase family